MTTRESSVDMLGILAEMTVFQSLTAEQLGELAQCCQVRSLAKGERIFHQGDKPRAFYHLVEGQIKRAVASAEGSERVLEILDPVQSFGEPELFGTRPYACFAEAVRPSVVLQIAKDAVHRLIERDARVALYLLAALAERQSALERDAVALHLQNGSDRIMEYLLDLAGSSLSTTGDTTLELGASKQLIAARLGLTAETFSRALRSLSDARLISVAGRRVTLHRPAASARTRAAMGARSSIQAQRGAVAHGLWRN